MKYKTTYFLLSLNSEISQVKDVYSHRINKQNLIDEIEKLEKHSEYIKIQKSFDVRIKKNETIIVELEKLLSSNRYVVSSNSYLISPILRLRRILRDIDNQRYTTIDNQLLTEHLNKNAVGGWKLNSMQPITKGLYDYGFSSDAGYGYGQNVIEGYVIIWEKP